MLNEQALAPEVAGHTIWPLRIYACYRLLLALLLAGIFVASYSEPLIGQISPAILLLTLSIYVIFTLIRIWYLFSRREYSRFQTIAMFVVDIAVISIVTWSSDSSQSNYSLLHLIAIIGANTVLFDRTGIFIAAIATLSTIAVTWLHIAFDQSERSDLVDAGLLGLAFFMSALVMQYLTQRILSAQLLAEQRKANIQNLTKINEQIVQRMKTGVMVVDVYNRVEMANTSAKALLGLSLAQRDTSVPQLPPELKMVLRRAPSEDGKTIKLKINSTSAEVQCTINSLSPERTQRLVFIEDLSNIQQHAQQLKLASLGRFTASIAHEIRNPLGAIGHAAQLLGESEHLNEGDTRLTEIIEKHVHRMNNVVENVLELSRRRLSQPERLELSAWLKEFCTERNNHGNQEQIELKNLARETIVHVDISQLEQILNNIINNGLYFSKQTTGKAHVRLVLGDAAALEGTVLDIIDDGPGVPENDREKVFEPFYTTQTKGNGLGLYITRDLCQSNQIRISCGINDRGESLFRLQFSHPDHASLEQD